MSAGAPNRYRLRLLLAIAVLTGAFAFPLQTLEPANASVPHADGGNGTTGCPASNPANELLLAAGTPQTAQLETAFASTLSVTFANTNGCPATTVAGTPITFTAPANGASGSFAASATNTLTVGADSSGNATAGTFTANRTPGTYTVTAASAYGSVSFLLTNTAAGIPATLTPVSPARQQARAGSQYRHPLSVRVIDSGGQPVANTTVTFTLADIGASVGASGSGDGSSTGGGGGGAGGAGATFAGGSSTVTAQTGSDGVATSPIFTANQSAGSFAAFASVTELRAPVSFELLNLPARGELLTRVGGWQRSARIGRPYGQRLRVRLREANGRPAIGATVTFTLATTSGGAVSAGTASGGTAAGASFRNGTDTATVTTGKTGIAVSPGLIANTAAGSFTAVASSTATTGVARFVLRNRAGRPETVTPGVGAAQSAVAGTRFEVPLAVTVTDGYGNAVAGVLVRFTAPATGPGGSFAGRHRPRTITVETDADGIAVAQPFIANNLVGGYVVTARVPNGRPTAFALVNQAP